MDLAMRLFTTLLVILFSSYLQAQSSSIIQFKNGEIADADDVNSNFSNLDDRVKSLEAGRSVSTSCSNDDMTGVWLTIINTPDSVMRCKTTFTGSNFVSSSSPPCDRLLNNGSSDEVPIHSGEVLVSSNCKVVINMRVQQTGTLIENKGIGWMSNDKQHILAATTNGFEGGNSSYTALKIN